MTIYTTPRLRLTPAEGRAADVMEWVHDQLLWDQLLCGRLPWESLPAIAVSADRNPAAMASLAAVALLEQVAFSPEFSVLRADDPMRLDMHEEDEGDR